MVLDRHFILAKGTIPIGSVVGRFTVKLCLLFDGQIALKTTCFACRLKAGFPLNLLSPGMIVAVFHLA